MNISIAVEKLLKYASVHLLTDEADENYLRNRLVEKLELKNSELYEIDEEDIFELRGPETLLQPLVDYALKNGLVGPSSAEEFAAALIDTVALPPSGVAQTFDDLYAISAQKAFDFLWDYNVKTGYIGAEAPCYKAGNSVVILPRRAAASKKRLRTLALPLSGDLTFACLPYGNFSAAGKVFKDGEVFSAGDIGLLSEFNAYAPFGGAAFAPGKEVAYCGGNIPVAAADTETLLSSESYPSLQITLLDWYCPAFRIAGGLGDAARLADELTADGGSVIVRGQGKDIAVYVACSDEDSPLPGTGVYILDDKTESELRTVAKYLTGAAIFSEGTMTDEIRVHSALIKDLTSRHKGLKEGEAFAATLAAYFEKRKTDNETFLSKHGLS